jgi:hypothetical protein
MKNRLLSLFICCNLSASCSTTTDVTKETYLKIGDTANLNKSFSIPDLYSHANFQNGEIVDDGSIQNYKTSCIVATGSLGPKTVQQNDYSVSKVSYYEDWYSSAGAVLRYYTEFHLKAASPDNSIVLTCQILDGPMQRHGFPLSEIRQATGQYFTFSSTDNR